MRLFEWNSEFEFGINEIDVQHKWLVDHVNEFYEQYKTSQSSEATMKMLDALIEYMNEHFACEEDYLLKHKYPDLEAHKKTHRDMSAKVYDLEKQFRETGGIPLDEFAGFLLQWLYGHIMKTDAAYAAYIKSQVID